MAKFALLFTGGKVPGDKRKQNVRDWTKWMSGLAEQGKLGDAASFGDTHKVVTPSGKARDYDWNSDSNVGGYCVVEAADMDAAIAMCQDCPQLKSDYGSGTIEVREIVELSEDKND